STVQVFDPSSLALMKTINLAKDCRGIAVNAAGHVFCASWDASIYHFDPSGLLLASLQTGIGTELYDIDLAINGAIVVGGRFGEVILTSESLSSKTAFALQSDTAFVAFSTPPAIAPSGVCVPKAPLGSACVLGADCHSGFCADGVCCSTVCNAGPCDACSVAAGAA